MTPDEPDVPPPPPPIDLSGRVDVDPAFPGSEPFPAQWRHLAELWTQAADILREASEDALAGRTCDPACTDPLCAYVRAENLAVEVARDTWEKYGAIHRQIEFVRAAMAQRN